MHTEKLTAVQRNHAGEIISFQTSEGRIISYRKALMEVEAGIIGDVDIISQDGAALLAVISNGSFDQLPEIY